MTGKSWEENPKYIPFNYVISHQKIRRQSHKLLNRRHLNFPTFGVHLHKNICESAVFGKKEEKEQKKNLQNNLCYLFPRARLRDTQRNSIYSWAQVQWWARFALQNIQIRLQVGHRIIKTIIGRMYILVTSALCCNSKKAWQYYGTRKYFCHNYPFRTRSLAL